VRIAVVIPTYNEAENLPGLIPALFALPQELTLLIMDDNSPDNTGHLADELATECSGRMSVLHRPGKLGISSAYVQGFKCVLKNNVDAIAQMDTDFSHEPSILVTMAKCLETHHVVVGSRYASGDSVDMQWPLWRKSLSAWGNLYARTILRIPVRDVTTGYRLWRSDTLRGMLFNDIQSKGYVFQVEMAYIAYCLEYRIKETPLYFADRIRGNSKMSLQIQMEAAVRVWHIWMTHRHLCHIGRAARAVSEQFFILILLSSRNDLIKSWRFIQFSSGSDYASQTLENHIEPSDLSEPLDPTTGRCCRDAEWQDNSLWCCGMWSMRGRTALSR
jgi:dolichol-phosphate mannosyltransferase